MNPGQRWSLARPSPKDRSTELLNYRKAKTMTSFQARSVALLAAVVACVSAAALAHAGHAKGSPAVVAAAPLAAAASPVGDTTVPEAGKVFAQAAERAADPGAPTF
jgi:hypothetical protein